MLGLAPPHDQPTTPFSKVVAWCTSWLRLRVMSPACPLSKAVARVTPLALPLPSSAPAGRQPPVRRGRGGADAKREALGSHEPLTSLFEGTHTSRPKLSRHS